MAQSSPIRSDQIRPESKPVAAALGLTLCRQYRRLRRVLCPPWHDAAAQLPRVLQVGARLTPSVPRVGFVGAKQRLTIAVTRRSQTTALMYLYGADSGPNIFNVTVAATDPAQLTNENIGLRLTVNGANIVVGLAWSSYEMDNTIESALGGVFNSLETNFGVFKSLAADGSGVTLLLATAPNITTLNVTAAMVVWPMYPFIPLPCNWTNPLLASALPDPPNPSLGMT